MSIERSSRAVITRVTLKLDFAGVTRRAYAVDFARTHTRAVFLAFRTVARRNWHREFRPRPSARYQCETICARSDDFLPRALTSVVIRATSSERPSTCAATH